LNERSLKKNRIAYEQHEGTWKGRVSKMRLIFFHGVIRRNDTPGKKQWRKEKKRNIWREQQLPGNVTPLKTWGGGGLLGNWGVNAY